MNCLAVECRAAASPWSTAALLFPDEPFGVDVISPDLSWLRERRDQVGAVFLTHGHEDHVGALPFLLRDLPVPVYGPGSRWRCSGRGSRRPGCTADLREVRAGRRGAARRGLALRRRVRRR